MCGFLTLTKFDKTQTRVPEVWLCARNKGIRTD